MNYRKALADRGFEEQFKNGRSGTGLSRYYLIIKATGQRATKMIGTNIFKGRITIIEEPIYVTFKNGKSDLADVIYTTKTITNADRALKELYEKIAEYEQSEAKKQVIEELAKD